MELLLLAFLSSLAAYVAGKRGRSVPGWFFVSVSPSIFMIFFMGWMLAGALFPLAAIACLLLLPAKWYTDADDREVAARDGLSDNYRKCPRCAEVVLREAVRCKHCQSDFGAA